MFIDGLISYLLMFLLGFVAAIFFRAGTMQYMVVLYGLCTITGWLYFAGLESSSKQATPGKMAMGIQVTDLNGHRISFGRATARYLGKILSSMILMIGYLMVLFTARKQGLHDLLAGCLVVRRPAVQTWPAAGMPGYPPPAPQPGVAQSMAPASTASSGAGPAALGASICPRCRKQVQPGARFCNNCGQPIRAN